MSTPPSYVISSFLKMVIASLINALPKTALQSDSVNENCPFFAPRALLAIINLANSVVVIFVSISNCIYYLMFVNPIFLRTFARHFPLGNRMQRYEYYRKYNEKNRMVKQRILQIIDNKKLTKSIFFQKTGLKRGFLG